MSSIIFVMDNGGGNSRAQVTFRKSSQAKKALKKNGEILGKKIVKISSFEDSGDDKFAGADHGDDYLFEPNIVVVSGLSCSVDNKVIEDLFDGLGHIVFIERNYGSVYKKFYGVITVHFYKPVAREAVKKNGKLVGNQRINVNLVDSGNSNNKKLIISNLGYNVEKSDIRKFFKDIGRPKIEFINSYSYQVTFSKVEQSRTAIKRNGEEILGRAIKIEYAGDDEDPDLDSSDLY